ncbi:hypothetical protein SAMN05421503_2274 [Terribacillus aidingensis]|uniref:Uncharacterized protein n=1 Tax=Terribacillus aidingensis TaxID=586416 RepID=A0A285NXL3_9BACI|nr:hypothetical protein [Terribacillus aidingensis]SNZ14224.1 hypothetical protein SAMN05421503_2274 [Terribacillus aidingensis]
MKNKKAAAAKKVNKPMTDKDWKELMGMNRDTYKRGKGGVIRSTKR